MKILAVDMDNTLTRNVCWTWDDCLNARPNRRMIKLVNDCYDTKEFKIVIYTARRRSLKTATEKWLKKHGVKYHKYGPRKMVYDYLFDDKAFRPEELYSP